MLVGIVLVQSGKGTGFASVFGIGGMGQSLFGAQTGNFLTRLTTILAIIFMVTSLSLAVFMGRPGRSVIDRMEEGEEGWEETEPAGEVEPGRPDER